jgi:hypothetical protein
MEQAILLDTNVLSELMRPQPDVQVLSWFDLNKEAGYYTSAVTQAEILLGISLLPPSIRQTRLADAPLKCFRKNFQDAVCHLMDRLLKFMQNWWQQEHVPVSLLARRMRRLRLSRCPTIFAWQLVT